MNEVKKAFYLSKIEQNSTAHSWAVVESGEIFLFWVSFQTKLKSRLGSKEKSSFCWMKLPTTESQHWAPQRSAQLSDGADQLGPGKRKFL